MKFLIDSMLPPQVAELLGEHGHDAMTPTQLGAHNLPDDLLIQLAAAQDRVIVTENAGDFAAATSCPVLLARKARWPASSPAQTLAGALDRWAAANREPGRWAYRLSAEFR